MTMGAGPREGGTAHLVVNLGLELDGGLDDVHGGGGTVGDGTSDGSSESEPEVRRRVKRDGVQYREGGPARTGGWQVEKNGGAQTKGRPMEPPPIACTLLSPLRCTLPTSA